MAVGWKNDKLAFMEPGLEIKITNFKLVPLFGTVKTK